MSPLTAMVSYSKDLEAAELLHTELALRGMLVVHDRCNFSAGSRIADEMRIGVAECDAFIPYFTPNSLYLDAASVDRPALDSEFKPAMQRRRDALARAGADPRDARPIIAPLAKRLGSRSEAAEVVFAATGEQVGSLWAPSTVFDNNDLSQGEAAAAARDVLRALLRAGAGTGSPDEPIEIVVASRGTGQAPRFLSLDATSLLGAERRAGLPDSWRRTLAALRDVEATLASHSPARILDVTLRTHLTAAFAFGRVFNQAAGWRLSVQGRQGSTHLGLDARERPLNTSWDAVSGGQELSVEIDFIGHPVFEMATETIRREAIGVVGRLQLRPVTMGEFAPDEIIAMVRDVTTAVRRFVGDTRPTALHLFMATPVEFAALLGRSLTALETEIQLYEREGDAYQPVLRLPTGLG